MRLYRIIAVALLAGFYPAAFFLSNNWHIFSTGQNSVLLVGTCLVSLIVLLSVSYLLDYILRRLTRRNYSSNESSDGRGFFFNPIFTFSVLIFCVFLLRNTLQSIEIHKAGLYGIIAAIIVVFTYIARIKGLKPILYALIILSSLSIINLFTSIHTNSKLPIENWAGRNKAIYSQVELTKRPNVYLIITESYPNKQALKAVYEIDNSSFYKKMNGLGMKFNDSHFSNYNHTLSSLPSLFAMEHHFATLHLGNFDSVGGRRMLEAKLYNPVIEIFRANDYKIQYLHAVSGLIPHGAAVDICIPSPSVLNGLKVFLTKQDITEISLSSREKAEIYASIKKQIATSSQEKDPYFTFMYLDFPGHSPSRLKDTDRAIINQKLGKFRNEYYENIDSANQRLFALIDFIIAQDPESIIVLIGDHGSWGFRIKEDAEGNRISNQLYTLDRFGVLAGIRGPDALSGLMESGKIKSHVNLFRYIFAHLSGDQTILSTKAPDDSYDQPFLLAIKNGKILDRFIRIVKK